MRSILLTRLFCVAILLLCLSCSNILPVSAINNITDNLTSSSISSLPYSEKEIAQVMNLYKNISNDESICVAIDLMKGTKGDYSRQVILGNNETNKSIKVMFKDLSTINRSYGKVNALGMKRGSQIYIYINEQHRDAPIIAISALLSHEALHQDAINSLSEETYAWTTEAIVWGELSEQYPRYIDNTNSLVGREKTLKLLYEKGGETSKYIKTIVYSSPSYQNLPETSPGFSVL